MTDLPEIYAICIEQGCNHVWTEPPTRPCPSCGTQKMPAFVDTRDGSSVIDPEFLNSLNKLAESVDSTQGAMHEQTKELEKLRDAKQVLLEKHMEEHGIMEGDPCPHCQRGQLVEILGGERKDGTVKLTCDMPHTICDYSVTVERVPVAEWPHPNNNDRKKGRHG